jgi:hypothetical protein
MNRFDTPKQSRITAWIDSDDLQLCIGADEDDEVIRSLVVLSKDQAEQLATWIYSAIEEGWKPTT